MGGADAYIDAFVAQLTVVRGLSENTAKGYAADLADFSRWAEREGVDALAATHKELRAYLAELSRARYATTTINRRLSAIRGLYSWLEQRGVQTGGAAAAVASPKIARRLPKTMSDAEAARLHTQRLTHLTRQVGIPGRRERGGRREAGRLLGFGDAQVIGVAELTAHAVGPVAHHEGGNACRPDRTGVPGAGTGQKRCRLQEGEVTSVRQCCVFHRRKLPFVLHRGYCRWFQCGPLSLRSTDRAHDLSFAGPVLHVRGLLSLR